MGRAAAQQDRRMLLLRRGLGTLWLVDALLQAQPRLFGNGMVQTILGPERVGEPHWLIGILSISIHLWNVAPPVWNTLAVLVQFGIGCALWFRPTRWDAVILAGSAAWILGIWIFGEGLGGIFVSGASLLTGAPGSVLLYLAPTGLLLWGALADRGLLEGAIRTGVFSPWTLTDRVLRFLLALVFLLGAVWQTAVLLHAPETVLEVGRTSLLAPQPSWVAMPLRIAVRGLVAGGPLAQTVTNLGLILLFLALTVWWLRPGTSRLRLVATLGVLALLWWFGMDLGVFGGTATDPNTPPILALWAVATAFGATPDPAGSLGPKVHTAHRWGRGLVLNPRTPVVGRPAAMQGRESQRPSLTQKATGTSTSN